MFERARREQHLRCTLQPQFVWLCTLLLTIALLFPARVASAEHLHKGATRDGSGLFALSLEEALDIQVIPAERIASPTDGSFILSSHELLRVYRNLIASPPAQNAVRQFENKKGVAVLIQGEYFGTFSHLREAIRLVPHMEGNVLRLYVGASAKWFAGGEYGVILDLTVPLPSSSDASSGIPAAAGALQDTRIRAEVQP